MCEVEGQSPTELYKLHYNVSSPAQPAQPSPATLALLHIERVARERSGEVEHEMDTLGTDTRLL